MVPEISMALRFIIEMPGVEMHSTHARTVTSTKRSAIEKLAQLCPKSQRIFRQEWSAPLRTIGLNTGCVAIQKLSDDIGNWDFDPL